MLADLPDDVFEPLTSLTDLRLSGNPEAPYRTRGGGSARWRNGLQHSLGDARRERQRRGVGHECQLLLGADRSRERGGRAV